MAGATASNPLLLADASTFPPVHALLPHCSAVLHSGSSRMVAAAAQAGLPQITCCRLEDQYEVVSIQHLTQAEVVQCSTSGILQDPHTISSERL